MEQDEIWAEILREILAESAEICRFVASFVEFLMKFPGILKRGDPPKFRLEISEEILLGNAIYERNMSELGEFGYISPYPTLLTFITERLYNHVVI